MVMVSKLLGLNFDPNPNCNFQKKIVVIREAVVIVCVVTSSNNACLCALNGVAA